MNIKEWLNTLPGSPTVSQAADHAGVSKATFIRHEKNEKTTAEYVIKISRAYDVNEIKALITLGFVNEAAVMEIAVEKALGLAKNSQILAEMNKRQDPEARRLYRAEGKPGVIDLDDHRSPDPMSGARDSMPSTAVADDSPDEDRMREDADGDWTDPDNIP